MKRENYRQIAFLPSISMEELLHSEGAEDRFQSDFKRSGTKMEQILMALNDTYNFSQCCATYMFQQIHGRVSIN